MTYFGGILVLIISPISVLSFILFSPDLAIYTDASRKSWGDASFTFSGFLAARIWPPGFDINYLELKAMKRYYSED